MKEFPWSVVVLALGALGLVAWLYVKSPEIQRKKGEAQDERAAEQRRAEQVDACKSLREQVLVAAQQGADVNHVQNLQAAYQACVAETGIAAAYKPPLLGAESKVRQALAEFEHFRGTTYDDTAKRNNTRNALRRLAGGFVSDVRAAVALARDEEAIAEIRRVVDAWVTGARDRVTCFLTAGTGCTRFEGSTEDHHNDKARDAYLTAVAPIVGAGEAGQWIRQRAGWPMSWIQGFDEAGPGLNDAINAKERELRAARAQALAAYATQHAAAIASAIGTANQGLVFSFQR